MGYVLNVEKILEEISNIIADELIRNGGNPNGCLTWAEGTVNGDGASVVKVTIDNDELTLRGLSKIGKQIGTMINKVIPTGHPVWDLFEELVIEEVYLVDGLHITSVYFLGKSVKCDLCRANDRYIELVRGAKNCEE